MVQKIIMCLLFVFIMSGCARNVEPTVENINKIFSSQDFTFEFHKTDGACESLSFRNDYLVYKSNKPTIRREITYEEVLLINDFIQKLVNLHSGELNPEVSPHYIIKNTAYKTVITPDQEDFYFKALIKTLKLK